MVTNGYVIAVIESGWPHDAVADLLAILDSLSRAGAVGAAVKSCIPMTHVIGTMMGGERKNLKRKKGQGRRPRDATSARSPHVKGHLRAFVNVDPLRDLGPARGSIMQPIDPSPNRHPTGREGPCPIQPRRGTLFS